MVDERTTTNNNKSEGTNGIKVHGNKENSGQNSTRKRSKGALSYRNLLANNSNLRLTGKPSSQPSNPTHSSLIADVADVRSMEQGLLRLLDDFHSGRLQAFGKDISFEKMESVREQQERLAKLHFDLQQMHEDTEDARRVAKENMSKLIDRLQQLSFSIEQLQSRSPGGTSTTVSS
ncbi:coiled-coil domain-containing protein 28B isoform X1 [Brevipalpus obovatus]|uniref:coiled-coil domain-containing protein 28B isoform X1 n=1 Tax=Brevipalpus obovatus TaxID=246614 RepID=UPI003D9DDB07